jgi:hypothetical protein
MGSTASHAAIKLWCGGESLVLDHADAGIV